MLGNATMEKCEYLQRGRCLAWQGRVWQRQSHLPPGHCCFQPQKDSCQLAQLLGLGLALL